MEEVKLLGGYQSPYSTRVELALKLKGVEYEYVEEDLQNKSDKLVEYNPIHKKIPVLVHNGKPILESLVILEYIDETWKGNHSLLPNEAYERAHARFLAKFIDDKLLTCVRDALVSQGEEGKWKMEEASEPLKVLENEIKGKKFFGGSDIGFLDICATVVAHWIPIFQKIGGKKLLTMENFPGICIWTNELLSCNIVKQNLPQEDKMIDYLHAIYQFRQATYESTNFDDSSSAVFQKRP